MLTIDEYLKSVFSQILDSVNTIDNLRNEPGDLDIIKKEISKITGQLQAAVKKLETSKGDSDKIIKLTEASKYYLENYDFINEIETMSKLYSEDTDRIRSMKLKILESLNDNKLLEKIELMVNS